MGSSFGCEQDGVYMQQALKQALKAYAADEVPIGAVIVDGDGLILSRAYNMVEQSNTQANHAEVLALKKAGKKRGDWRLEGCWLYVTLEPCTMCMALVGLSRLSGVVFGASSPLFGYRLDKEMGLSVYKRDTLISVEGIYAQECAQLLKQFFKKKRMKRE